MNIPHSTILLLSFMFPFRQLAELEGSFKTMLPMR
jgi:hypothetical protein